MALTEMAIKHLKPKEKTYGVGDSGGLCLEISAAGGIYGTKIFSLRFGKFRCFTKTIADQI